MKLKISPFGLVVGAVLGYLFWGWPRTSGIVANSPGPDGTTGSTTGTGGFNATSPSNLSGGTVYTIQ